MCASRAPLAERAAVNRQVLGSIPSGGAIFFLTINTGGSNMWNHRLDPETPHHFPASKIFLLKVKAQNIIGISKH